MPATVGRNDPCPCGSGNKYKKCCERVVAIQSAEQIRVERLRKTKYRLLMELNEWFEQVCSNALDGKWSFQFKESLQLSLQEPIPSRFSHAYRFWLLFDAPCYRGQRPVECWRKQMVRRSSEEQQIAKKLSEIYLCCYEVADLDKEHVLLRSMVKGTEFTVQMKESVQTGMLLFARLSSLMDRYELFGPYTFFGEKVRGKLQMYLKKQQKEWELNREYWQQNGLHVLGWSIERAQEMERRECPKTVDQESQSEISDLQNEWIHLPTLPNAEAFLPDEVEQHFDLFQATFVKNFQSKTQELYVRSLNLLKEYISSHFGKRFTWSLFNRSVLSHLFGVWYVDNGKGGIVQSRIFLNTLKGLFQWIRDEGICDFYSTFTPVYLECIQMLPLSYEVKQWLCENCGLQDHSISTDSGVFKLSVSSVKTRLKVKDQWIPLQASVRGLPTTWLDHRFWLKGKISIQSQTVYLVAVEAVYPCLSVSEEL